MNSEATVPGRGNTRKAIAIVIVVIFVVAFVGAALTIMLIDSGDKNTPSRKFSDYMDAVEQSDGGRLYNDTIWSLNQSLYGEWSRMTDLETAEYQITLHSVSEIYVADMTSDQKTMIDEMILTIEDLLNVTVQDYCYVHFNATVMRTEVGDEPEWDNYTEDIPLVEVDGAWYLVAMLDDLEEIFNPTVVTPAATYAKTTITNGKKIMILSISMADVVWDDILIMISDGTNICSWAPIMSDLSGGTAIQMNYSSQLVGPLRICCIVTDIAGNGVVNGGDYISLFTYGGAPTFESGVIYTVILVYEPTGGQIGIGMTFTG